MILSRLYKAKDEANEDKNAITYSDNHKEDDEDGQKNIHPKIITLDILRKKYTIRKLLLKILI